MKTNRQKQTQVHPNTRSRIDDLARTVLSIDAQQEVQPGYCLDIAQSIINAELSRLWDESYGQDLGSGGRI